MKKLDFDETELRSLVGSDVQMWKIAEQFCCSKSCIERRMKKLGLKAKRTGPKSGARHTNWKGGRKIVKGYVYIYSPNHPHKTKSKYVSEHRLVMEKKLERFLHPKEVVHHRDGNPMNNHPDNLECFGCNSEHLKHELTGKIPNWTNDGKKRISEGIKKSLKQKRNLNPSK